MRFEVGIDEAGYGPNLGPFVMSMVVFEATAGDGPADGWQRLAPIVRRSHGLKDDRVIVDDSKKVYSARQGLAVLERHLCPFFRLLAQPATVADLWNPCVLHEPLLEHDAPWLNLNQPWPLYPEQELNPSWQRLEQVSNQAGYRLLSWKSVVLFPRHCNDLIRKWDSKASLPLAAIERLLDDHHWPGPVEMTIDRLGGRQHYHAFLQHLFPNAFVTRQQETARISRYRIGPEMSVQFVVEADQLSFPVALASMISKYLREFLMRQFNDYWCGLLPGLEPTAGYPVDAERWRQATAALRDKRHIPEPSVWRMR